MHQPPQDVIDAARAAMVKWKIPASVTLAQWALESGWGAHLPAGSCNPFGIKARTGDPSVTVPTREVVNGQSITIHAAFRKFDSIAEAFDDHGQLLATAGAYASARACIPDAAAFANALTGHYATDPNYGALLNAIMRGSNLFQYDTGAIAA